MFTKFQPVHPPLGRPGCRSKVGRMCFGLNYARLVKRVSVYLKELVPLLVPTSLSGTKLYRSASVTAEFSDVSNIVPSAPLIKTLVIVDARRLELA